MLGEMWLRQSDNLSRALHMSYMSAAQGQMASMIVKKSLVMKRAGDLGIQEPVLPRHRKRPKRYKIGEGGGYAVEDVETRYRVVYFEALDLLINGIKDCFQQPGYQNWRSCWWSQDTTEELEFICRFYGDDLHADVLKMQLEIMATNLWLQFEVSSSIPHWSLRGA